MKKKVFVLSLTAATVVGAGIAWAVLGGTITLPGVAEGLALPVASSSCQVGAIDWTVPPPTFNNVTTQYETSTVAFAGFDSGCVTLGATLDLQVIDSNGDFLTTGSLTPNAVGGTVPITAVPFDDMVGASFIYLVAQ